MCNLQNKCNLRNSSFKILVDIIEIVSFGLVLGMYSKPKNRNVSFKCIFDNILQAYFPHHTKMYKKLFRRLQLLGTLNFHIEKWKYGFFAVLSIMYLFQCTPGVLFTHFCADYIHIFIIIFWIYTIFVLKITINSSRKMVFKRKIIKGQRNLNYNKLASFLTLKF